jgi:hypothetical protein
MMFSPAPAPAPVPMPCTVLARRKDTVSANTARTTWPPSGTLSLAADAVGVPLLPTSVCSYCVLVVFFPTHRKMQSLRREFGKARVLMQLVVERELLKHVRAFSSCLCLSLLYLSTPHPQLNMACIPNSTWLVSCCVGVCSLLPSQSQLRVQEEIFQQRLFNMSELGQGSEPRTEESFRHKLRFDHLLAPVSVRPVV